MNVPHSFDFFSLVTTGFDPDLKDKPLWLLDIDGVINAYSWDGKRKEDGHNNYQKHMVKNGTHSYAAEYKFWVSPTVVEFINEIANSKRAQIAWLTTWQEMARKIVAPKLGLADFPLAGTDGGRFSDYYWKNRTGLEALHLNRPILWTDDDVITDTEAKAYAKHTKKTGIEHLLVTPNPKIGLSPSDLEQIDKYLPN